MIKKYKGVLIIGTIEVLIGVVTIFFNIVTLLYSCNDKTPNVLAFVIIAGMTSSLIGVGILTFHKRAYQILLYFASVVFLSKILIFLNVIELNGALETSIPPLYKRLISLGYHAFVIIYLSNKNVRKAFYKEVDHHKT